MTSVTTLLRPAAALWDMDGTIIDSEPAWLTAESEMLQRYGLAFPEGMEHQMVGQGLTSIARLFQELGVPLTVDEIIGEWADRVAEEIRTSTPRWMPGAVELLGAYRAAGVPNALVTMSVRRIADTVVALLPEGTFDAVIVGDEVDHEKPHPDPYLRAASALGVDPADCVAFEDSQPGTESAAAAGAFVVGVPNLVSLEGSPAHATLPSLAEVTVEEIAELWRAHRAHPAREEEPAHVTHSNTPAYRGPFGLGDRVQLTGPKGRINTITLESGGEFHSHTGIIYHDDLVGLPDASVIANSQGEEYLAIRPLLTDFVMSMPRGAAIVYPKDAAQILSLADIFPGARVVEAGVGSGALSLHLLRAIGAEGELHSFERREEFAEIARANGEAFAGKHPSNWTIRVGDLQETLPAALENGSVDRVVLDMLAPWECVDVTANALTPGGVVICYVATVTQLSRTVEEFRRSGLFTHPQASETMVRGWHVEGLAVRPDHRMVAHTGFLMTARRLAPGALLPSLKRRASKSEFSDEDLATWLPDMGAGTENASSAVWTPEAVGERPKSDKILRKKLRDARQLAEKRAAGEPGA